MVYLDVNFQVQIVGQKNVEEDILEPGHIVKLSLSQSSAEDLVSSTNEESIDVLRLLQATF